VWQLRLLVFRSAKPSSPWPVAPCWPTKVSASCAARHSGGPDDGTVVDFLAVLPGAPPAVPVEDGGLFGEAG
jgi:hypothetical protein